MLTSRLRLITFDVTNTLLKFRSNPGQQYGEIGATYGIICDNNNLSANFKAHWRKMSKEHPNFGLLTGLGWEKWWTMVVKGTFKDSNFNLEEQKLDAVALHLIEAYKTSACWQQCYGAIGLLSYIRSKGIRMGIVSNFDPRLNITLENMKLRHYFQSVITSYEVGVEKPDPRIFEEAMYHSKIKNLKPDECLHVGDEIFFDYNGAKSSGWHAALIDNNRNIHDIKKKYPYVDSNYIFANLYDLHKHFIESFDDKITSHSLF
ncbi:unnamed protein product [Phaedon cochleariae]|uniref:Rhythmically expressed gene 2 protein n=1 Tax=Phaedon cochleariae TaxID=80249 RepID=A0A9P0DHU3_PHACE|nr:unnamed protein product [Phaedon cochleariae]